MLFPAGTCWPVLRSSVISRRRATSAPRPLLSNTLKYNDRRRCERRVHLGTNLATGKRSISSYHCINQESISNMSDLPPVPTKGGQPRQRASLRIPPICQPFVSDRAKKVLDIVEEFVDEECIPADNVYSTQIGTGDERWNGHPSILDDLKKRARELGLWNMFLPKNHYSNLAEYDPYGGAGGFTNVEYGLMAELLGRSRIASEATNCTSDTSHAPPTTLPD